jgi:Na+-driven multidrug efflux pump
MSTGKAFYQMISQIAGAVVNIALVPIMIFGWCGMPAMGVAGAAVATVIGEGSACALALYFNLAKNKEINFSFRGFRPDWAVMRKICAVGVPAILLGVLFPLTGYGLNRILMGTPDSTAAVAILGAYIGLESFILMPVFGLNNALIPIVAYNFGARNKGRMLRAIELSGAYALGIMFTGLLLFQIFPDKLLLIFNASAQMLSLGQAALRIISWSYPFAALWLIFNAVFQALGQGRDSLLLNVFRQSALLLAAWLFSLTGRLWAIWWAFPLATALALAYSVSLLRRVYAREIKPLPD